jgi:large subunit ribosomal protein L22
MVSKAIARYIRVPPKKARQIIRLIKGKNPNQALGILAHTNKRSAGYVAKVLKSAIANAGAKPDIKQEDLYISRIIVDGGPSLKRFRPRAMGRATAILKRTSHISVELDSKPSKLKSVPPQPGVKAESKSQRVPPTLKLPPSLKLRRTGRRAGKESESQRVKESKSQKGKTKVKAIKKAKSQTK